MKGNGIINQIVSRRSLIYSILAENVCFFWRLGQISYVFLNIGLPLNLILANYNMINMPSYESLSLRNYMTETLHNPSSLAESKITKIFDFTSKCCGCPDTFQSLFCHSLNFYHFYNVIETGAFLGIFPLSVPAVSFIKFSEISIVLSLALNDTQ